MTETKTSGWVIFDKPENISSNKCMCRLRSILKSKTGYVGTLDPFAQGVLPIALGHACKFIQFVNDDKKEYIFSVKFGEETDTLDRSGNVIKHSTCIPKIEEIYSVLKGFTGEISQKPPNFSAVKVNGVRAYKLARRGVKNIEVKSRKVNIFELEILNDNLLFEKTVTFRCLCSRGTYIRSLARDIAEKLNTYAHVVYLRRTFVNFIDLSKILSFDKIELGEYNKKIEQFILPCESALDDIPALTLDEKIVNRLQNGQRVFYDQTQNVDTGVRFKIFNEHNNMFCGVCEFYCERSVLIPLRMIV